MENFEIYDKIGCKIDIKCEEPVKNFYLTDIQERNKKKLSGIKSKTIILYLNLFEIMNLEIEF